MLEFINQELESLKKSGLYRPLKTIEKIDGSKIYIDGKELICFCSNDYLGLSNHPKVKKMAIETIKEFGVGAGASRLISGNTIIHEELEKKIAKFKKRESAIVFSTGYMANIGAITALTDEKDTIIIDRLNHASIIDACKLSKARLQVYSHKDMIALEKILAKSDKYKKRLIVTDSIFSMDGDIAPLPQIAKLAKKYNAITMIDCAHATGVLGENGRGAEEHFGIEGQIDIVMGTLSKAVGSLGGFIAGSFELIDFLRNKARSFIYTTSLPPSICAASIAALEIIENEPQLRKRLWDNIGFFNRRRAAINRDPTTETPIIPIIIGNEEKTMGISRKLFEDGLFVSGIRFPTVAKGEARLRITITANHSKKELEMLSNLLALI
ncbi:8-amino-7-oxononanoate synthase [candidate division WOR-1 bacterium RIFOXYA2_FULL_37_7]|uniref:8-amino-7-ketopelargonate synthase n=1 Tax=candidate division WOR-1 bacterium RIFOXYB2_FULL_37_13 TaxID=1802579 RepID=A0A1F4ST07_UNCSA|nr:MAG: 8-amino-7-oxononanoate synthase [candidate division WOR-1 bacterium RIFOXYA2_FULL_37_7]OGC23566.1 MAG: 8-amino-7-oxononanoate synthase [candidate division WOR-1 bacterium RIFOXYB2_FULL_37_13]